MTLNHQTQEALAKHVANCMCEKLLAFAYYNNILQIHTANETSCSYNEKFYVYDEDETHWLAQELLSMRPASITQASHDQLFAMAN